MMAGKVRKKTGIKKAGRDQYRQKTDNGQAGDIICPGVEIKAEYFFIQHNPGPGNSPVLKIGRSRLTNVYRFRWVTRMSFAVNMRCPAVCSRYPSSTSSRLL